MDLLAFLVVNLEPRVLGLELRDDLFHQTNHIRDDDGAREPLQFLGSLQGIGIVILADLGDADAVVRRRERVLRIRQHLLVELLARTKSRIFNLDILVDLQTGQLDHALGQVGDLHRLTHVEDKNLRSGGHRGGLHHQPAGLRNRHEEARDVGVRYRYRAALGDLLAEARDHRTVRSQYVAETRGDELRLALHLAGLDGQTERLHVDLCQTLRAAHDVGRVDGLVGRDHDHLLDVVFDTLVGHVA